MAGIPDPVQPRRRTRRTLAGLLPPVVSFAVIFGGWEWFVRSRGLNEIILPAPSAIVAELWAEPGRWWDDAVVTGSEAALGLLVATVVAIALAIAISHSVVMDRALTPVITMVQVTPVIALATPLTIWLGFGLAPKVVLAALITFVPMAINATTGFRAIDPTTHELLRSVAASRAEVFWHLRVPHALPYIFSALRVCVGLALIGALVAEWFGSTEGLGRTMTQARNSLAYTKLWAAVAVLTLMGIAGTTVVRVVERSVLRWHPGER
ncbi:MAG: ABC transporter permease [Acidimicrobiales bacterium]